MAIQRTFAMIKPDAIKAGNMGRIISMIEDNGFKIIHARLLKFTEKSFLQFYQQNINQSYIEKLKDLILSDKIMAMVLEKEEAIEDFKKLMGNKNPKKAKRGTIRKKFGTNIISNAIHGSDSEEVAKKEITYIFGEYASIPSSLKINNKEY